MYFVFSNRFNFHPETIKLSSIQPRYAKRILTLDVEMELAVSSRVSIPLFDVIMIRHVNIVNRQIQYMFLPTASVPILTRSQLFRSPNYVFKSVVANYKGKDYELGLQTPEEDYYIVGSMWTAEMFAYVLWKQHAVIIDPDGSQEYTIFMVDNKFMPVSLIMPNNMLAIGLDDFRIMTCS